MKRKKFIKMLMWAGMSRNDAADVAQLAQEAGRPYFKVLGELLNFHRQDFGNPLAWAKMRYTIIHGHNSPAGRFFANIDEMANHKDPAVEQALAAGTAAKPQPVAGDERPPIIVSEREIRTFAAQVSTNWLFEMTLMPAKEKEDYIKRKLVKELAKGLLDGGLCKIQARTDERTGGVVYRATIDVAVPQEVRA